MVGAVEFECGLNHLVGKAVGVLVSNSVQTTKSFLDPRQADPYGMTSNSYLLSSRRDLLVYPGNDMRVRLGCAALRNVYRQSVGHPFQRQLRHASEDQDKGSRQRKSTCICERRNATPRTKARDHVAIDTVSWPNVPRWSIGQRISKYFRLSGNWRELIRVTLTTTKRSEPWRTESAK
jgi:hypothetical protein